jgi:hypothetical protein
MAGDVAPASVRFDPEQRPSRLPIVADLPAYERPVDRDTGVPAKRRCRINEVGVRGAPAGASMGAKIKPVPVCRQRRRRRCCLADREHNVGSLRGHCGCEHWHGGQNTDDQTAFHLVPLLRLEDAVS